MTSAYAFFDKDIHLLTMQDGLVDNTVTCIYKDEDGFMWFGTNNGLSRYDGKAIKNFSPLETSIPVEEIVKLSGDYLGIVAGMLHPCSFGTKDRRSVGIAFIAGGRYFFLGYIRR